MKTGYKQTEVGVIPEDWEVKPLGECASFRTGPFGSALHKSDYTDDGIPIVNPMHIIDGRIEPTRTMTITEQAAKALADFRLKAGEIVIGRRGDMGRCAVVMNEQAGWLCGTGSMIIRGGATDINFLQRVISSPRAISAIEETSVGSTMINLNQRTLAGLRLQFPPLPEQRAIAAALSDVDGLLGALDRLIAKKRDLKQAAMQQLLTGQTRLPGFKGEWVVKTVAELEKLKLVKLSRGQVISKKDIDRTPGDYPIYSSSIHNDGLFGRYGYFMFDEELITWSVDGGGNFFHRRKHRFSVTNVCGFMRVDTSQIDCRFFAAELQLLHSRKNFDYQSKAHPSVIRKEYEVQLPPLPEQTAIASILSEMDAELAALEQRREKTRALKQGMMQELLTGRTRLVSKATPEVKP
jgi:type I restriction enzyme S subunit